MQVEVEIKSLLEDVSPDALRKKFLILYPKAQKKPIAKQKNHYFLIGNITQFLGTIAPYITHKKLEELRRVLALKGMFSFRTRATDTKQILFVKASLDDTTSANGRTRVEFETEVPFLSLDELDVVLLKCGFSYQAKWSRVREEYIANEVSICIDKNAGYGYIVEFEIVVRDAKKIDNAKHNLYQIMESLGLKELPQERLERMFAYYNAHWQDYYGTEKTFIIA